MKAAAAPSIAAPSPSAGGRQMPTQIRGGKVSARLSLPEHRAIERLNLAGILGIGDVEGPLQDELQVVAATRLSAPKALAAAGLHSPRGGCRRVEIWTCGARLRDRVKAELKPRLSALGVVVRGIWVRMSPEDLEAEIRAAGARVGVSVFGAD